MSWDRIVIRPADVPAAELPEPEPTLADLLAIEHGDEVLVQHRINRAQRVAALEHTHRELMGLRRRYRDAGDDNEFDSTTPTTTTFWRAA
ncbi:hypothetical protein FFT09_22735 [Saccharomonospora piscinae]|uniref:hypothetical protein n=1 Tax=Saccharomonospora piscinae TaxID=687388 RepID=UPI001105FCD0|nr:hypothetical protein [Saccharomonospora piscinae]TLW89246.1 hypothetical protein FFT09_22735 [Saccharomonospora piscinae]